MHFNYCQYFALASSDLLIGIVRYLVPRLCKEAVSYY
jgi:hypothetical protein